MKAKRIYCLEPLPWFSFRRFTDGSFAIEIWRYQFLFRAR
jgi:hypothetical protein